MTAKGSPNRPNAPCAQPPGGGMWRAPLSRSTMPDAPPIQNTEKPKKNPKKGMSPSCCPLRGSRRIGSRRLLFCSILSRSDDGTPRCRAGTCRHRRGDDMACKSIRYLDPRLYVEPALQCEIPELVDPGRQLKGALLIARCSILTD